VWSRIPSVVEINGDSGIEKIGTGTPPSVNVIDGDASAIDVVDVQEVCLDEDDDIDAPEYYMFPSFVVFMLYGPFVSPDKQLNHFQVDNSKVKKGEGTHMINL